MPIYQYKARDEQGRLITGRVDVTAEEELRKRLESSGLILVQFSLLKRDILNATFFYFFLYSLLQSFLSSLFSIFTCRGGVFFDKLTSIRFGLEGFFREGQFTFISSKILCCIVSFRTYNDLYLSVSHVSFQFFFQDRLLYMAS